MFLLIAIFILTILSLHAATQMIFGVLGTIPEDPAWAYSIALFVSLSTSIIPLAIAILSHQKSRNFAISSAISALGSGAWLGFYYGGILAGGKNPQLAIAGTTIGSAIAIISAFYWRRKSATPILVTVGGIVAAYGLTFMCAAAAFAFLSVGNLGWGIVWGCLGLGSIALVGYFLNFSISQFRKIDSN